VKVAAKDINNKETQKLSRSLHSISVQNELLKHENKGLREALAARKKHQKRGKPLDLQQRKEYHGGAVVWSPRKVREARARQAVQEREEKELQLQKAKSAEIKKAAQLYKLKITREKRVAREAAKVVREKEKTEKAKQVAERARQRDAQNTIKALRLSKESKRKASQPLEQNTKRKKQVVDAVGGGEASEAALAAPSKTTRHGRNVKLPDRYK
jgi:hypothetical protein